MKITILKYDHRDGCDLSAHATYELANKARAEICATEVDNRIHTPPTVDDDPNMTISERVKQLYEVRDFDECVRVYLSYNQDESLDLEEVEVQGFGRPPDNGQVPDVLLHYRGSGTDLATDIKAVLTPHELQRLKESL